MQVSETGPSTVTALDRNWEGECGVSPFSTFPMEKLYKHSVLLLSLEIAREEMTMTNYVALEARGASVFAPVALIASVNHSVFFV